MGDSGGYSGLYYYIKTVHSSKDTVTIDLTSKVRINGLNSIQNVYYLIVQLVINNRSLGGIVSLPAGSPTLTINVMCDLVG